MRCRDGAICPPIIACGVLWFGAYNVALNAGERLIDAGTAAMLVNVAPILIALSAVFVLRERVPRPLLAGLAVAFAGAVVIGVGSGRHHGGVGGVLLCGLAAIVRLHVEPEPLVCPGQPRRDQRLMHSFV